MKLSVVILTKNEKKNVERCIRSVSFADEVVVVDDNSKDNTLQRVKKTGVEVYQRALRGDFSAQRNFGMKKSRGDWTLFIDADEVVTEELRLEILKQIQDKNIKNTAYHIKRRDWFWGRELKHGEVRSARNKGFIRLVKRNSGSWRSPVHEIFKTIGPIGRLKNYIDHHPHQTVKEFLEDINLYSTLRAYELQKQGKRVGILKILLWPLGKFMVNYFIRFGFLDGPAGFTYAFMMSFHSFLVRAKLFQYLYL